MRHRSRNIFTCLLFAGLWGFFHFHQGSILERNPATTAVVKSEDYLSVFHDCEAKANETISDFNFLLKQGGFKGGSVYIKKGLFLCISEHSFSQPEKALWQTWVQDHLAKEMSMWLAERASLSSKILNLKNDLISDLRWLDKQFEGKPGQSCVSSVLQNFLPQLREKYSYLNVEAELTTLIEPMCLDVATNADVVKVAKEKKKENFEQKINEWLPALDEYVKANDQHEEEAISEWLNSSELKPWVKENKESEKILKAKAHAYLDSKRDELQK